MDRHPGWAVIVCLVGGGQEINTGEAGLVEWFEALRSHFAHWRVWHAPSLADDEYAQGKPLMQYFPEDRTRRDPRLHLAVSLRSYRAENVSNFVKAVLDNDLDEAKELYQRISVHYPLALTRDVNIARAWLRAKARGTERYGLLASSGGLRLRAIGLHVKNDTDVINWFLNEKDDVRSSYCLEEVATEFHVQGLELDWTCLAWDADLRYGAKGWQYRSFRGTQWQNVNDEVRQRYLRNAYRVLMTRARQGMVIFVPEGDVQDPTRLPEYYDRTYAVLKAVGLAELGPDNLP